MKQCLTCSNQVPDGRVVAKCDGCLALFYYGNALDQIVDLLQESGRPKLGLMHEIAQKAIRSVPRTADPAGRDPAPFDLRAYAIERRKLLGAASGDCGAKHAASADNLGRSTFTDRDWGAVRRAKIDFGTYRWVQGRLAEIDDLIRWIEQGERENEELPVL